MQQVDPKFSPPRQTWEKLTRMFRGSPVDQDAAAMYVRGDFHGKVVLQGARCVNPACDAPPVEVIKTTSQLPGPDGKPLARLRSLPVRLTWQQVQGGMSCTECGEQCRMDYTTGAEGGPIQTFLKGENDAQ